MAEVLRRNPVYLKLKNCYFVSNLHHYESIPIGSYSVIKPLALHTTYYLGKQVPSLANNLSGPHGTYLRDIAPRRSCRMGRTGALNLFDLLSYQPSLIAASHYIFHLPTWPAGSTCPPACLATFFQDKKRTRPKQDQTYTQMITAFGRRVRLSDNYSKDIVRIQYGTAAAHTTYLIISADAKPQLLRHATRRK